jgi:trimeric autotransporter adhesin
LETLKRSVIFFALVIISSFASAQVTIVADDFEDGNISLSPAWSGNTNKYLVSNTSSLEGNYSLKSNTGNAPSSIYTQYGTNTNLTSANYTWTLLYRDNGLSNPDELPWGAAINSGNNHWRYWIAANSTDAANCDGFYISHSAGNLKFCRKLNSTWEIMTYPISLNTTYSIKINRRTDGYWYVYIDAGTGEATTLRWEGWATDIFNSGTNNIYTVFHSNETTANRFQWDRTGMTSKSLSIAQLTQGIATGDLEEGMTNKALFGFSASANGGSITLKEVYIANTNSNNSGTFSNTKLYTSIDNSYATAGDNSEVTGINLVLNGTKIDITNINHAIASGTSKNYFLVTDIANNTSGNTPPANIQFSIACNSCGPSNTKVVTDNGEKVNDFSFSGTNYNFIRVFTWRNTSTVGDYTDDWQNASAWEPYRNSPSVNDILKFGKGGTVTPLNIPSETVKKIIFTGNTIVNVTTNSLTNGSRILTVNGGSDDDLIMDAGSTLNITSSGNTLGMSLEASTTASLSGTILISGKNHTIISASASAVTFKSGASLTCSTGTNASPFANSANNSVIFASGSTLIDMINIDFLNGNKMSFQSGSTYRVAFNAVPYLDGKTYANFEINNSSFNRTITGTAGFTLENLTLTSATTLNISNTGTKNINGNLTVTAGTLNFNPGSASTLSFTKNGTQIISGSGTLTIGTNCNITISSTSNVSLSKNISIPSVLTLNGKLTLNTQVLTLSGTVTGTGTLSGSSTSDLSVTGSGSLGTLYFDQTNSLSRTLRNLTINRTSGSVTLGNAMELKSVLTVSNGTLVSGGNLTLISDASGTARVASLTSGSVTGNVTAQRYIPGGTGKRRYRTISSPVNVSGSITYSQIIDDTYITNPGAPGNGFDQSPQQNSSAYTYNESVTGGMNTGWVTPTNVTNTIATGKGVMITIRGDRNTPDPFSPYSTPNNCTMDFIGTLNSGNISPSITYTNTGSVPNDGWNLIGNPYPSPITWTSGITKTNISNTIYIYNPNTGTYGSWNGIVGTNGCTAFIASGQAFFIKASTANPAITFTENAKTSSTPSNFFRSANDISNQLNLILYKDSLNSDEAVVALDDSSRKVYDEEIDALKFQNGTINIFTRSLDNTELSINNIPTPSTNDTIPVTVTGANSTYQFRIKNVSSFDKNISIYVLDNFTSRTYEITSDTSFIFDIVANAASQGNDRFKLIFSRTSAPLPVQLISFTGKMKDHQAELKWSTATEINNDHFTIERSTDGKTFKTIATIEAAKNGNQVNNYNTIDHDPFDGINYYRLNQFDKNGKSTLHKVIALENHTDQYSAWTVYPNPASDYLNIHFTNDVKENMEIEVFDIYGKQIFKSTYPNPGNLITLSCSDFRKGIYVLKINTVEGIRSFTFNKF